MFLTLSGCKPYSGEQTVQPQASDDFSQTEGVEVLPVPSSRTLELFVSCDDYTDSEAMLWARYTENEFRKTLDVTLKMPVTQANLQNPERRIYVDVHDAGLVRLEPNQREMMTGSLTYDSYAIEADSNNGVFPFPTSWVGAHDGSVVSVGDLSCEMLS